MNNKEKEAECAESVKKCLEGKVLDSYELASEGVKTQVNIIEKDYMPFYKLVLPEVDIATKALLDDIKERLIGAVDMNVGEVFDTKIMEELRKEFRADASKMLTEELPNLPSAVKDNFILSLVHELLGLGDMEFLLDDNFIEEVVVNSAKEPIRIYHKKHGWLRTSISPPNEAAVLNYANTIARRVGREITTLNPLLDAHLVSGDRVNATLNPISSKGHTMTIRKFARDPWTVTDFVISGDLKATSCEWCIGHVGVIYHRGQFMPSLPKHPGCTHFYDILRG